MRHATTAVCQDCGQPLWQWQPGEMVCADCTQFIPAEMDELLDLPIDFELTNPQEA